MAPGEDTDSGMESQESSLMESQASTASGKPQDIAEASHTSTVVGTNAEFSPENKPDSDDAYSDEV